MKKGLFGRDLLRIGDHRLGLADEIGRQVIALFRRLVGFGLAVVAHELRVILMRIAAKEAVVALEAATERPAVIRARRRRLLGGRQMPLAKGVGVVAVLQQDFREHPVLERNVAVAAGIAGRSFGDAGHAVRVMVAPGHETRARRRTQRRRVHVAVSEPIGRERVEIGGSDRAAVAAEVAEAGVIKDDEEHVRRALPRPVRRRPRRLGHVERPADYAGKRLPRLVLLKRHESLPPANLAVPRISLQPAPPEVTRWLDGREGSEATHTSQLTLCENQNLCYCPPS